MKFKLLLVVKALALLLSITCFFSYNFLYWEYLRGGVIVACGEFQVLMNQHGSYRYITTGQYRALTGLQCSYFGLFLLAGVTDKLEKRLREREAARQ